MKEFFVNIVNWFVQNKDGIITTLLSSNFIGFITAIILLIRQIRSSKDNTSATNALNENIKQNATVNDAITGTKTSVQELVHENQQLKAELIELKDSLYAKVNAMMEVQSLVYSTIKDEKTRTTVQNILTNAKLAENKTRAELEAEVESLRDKLAAKVEDVKKLADTAVESIKKVVSPEVKEEAKENEIVRY